jgi:hypothetical protein
VHYGIVRYGTDPNDLSQTAKSPIWLNPDPSVRPGSDLPNHPYRRSARFHRRISIEPLLQWDNSSEKAVNWQSNSLVFERVPILGRCSSADYCYADTKSKSLAHIRRDSGQDPLLA